ncbi:MAG: hypothetical protein JJT75_03055 [Opitutales bacterium]|nr:hypothetical protein [Opitutales bacterium]MCH8541828.1 hypothetical protein [Opitutales bacterium]
MKTTIYSLVLFCFCGLLLHGGEQAVRAELDVVLEEHFFAYTDPARKEVVIPGEIQKFPELQDEYVAFLESTRQAKGWIADETAFAAK